MKRGMVMAMLVAASVAGAVPAHAKTKHSGPSCKAVHEALASGKSKEAVAAQMKTTTAAVEQCEAKAGTSSSTSGAKKSSAAK